MLCCLNPACHNPPVSDSTVFCPNCDVGLFILKNRYRPIQSLGGGGFGKTYLAEDIDKLNEKCVIKLFAPQVQGTAGLQKATELFEQEARRLQQLGEHPQIPTLLAYFREDSRLYLVQQFIDGQNLLKQLEQQGTFSEAKIRDLLQDLLNILKIVHQQKVIHRDVKPENIILRSDGKVVLIDFGASKQITQTVMTGQGTMIGSFGYAPLEQMQGGEAYPASDLFSLGATCFHLLSGIHPWELWKSQGYAWVGSWRKHLQQPVSQELGLIIDKLLQEDYQRRYQLADEVLQDLNSAPQLKPNPKLAHQTQPSPSVNPTPKPAQLTSRPIFANLPQKKSLILGSTVLLLLLGLGIFTQNQQSFIENPIVDVISQQALVKTINGGNSVSSIVISPDGSTIAAGVGGTIMIWNWQTSELKSTFTGHTDSVRSVAISSDMKTLVSGSSDGTIRIWDLQTGKSKSTITEGTNRNIWSTLISTDGKNLIGTVSGTIKIWNLQTGELKSNLTGDRGVSTLAISSDGKLLVGGSYDGTIQIWNLQAGILTSTLPSSSFAVESIAISSNGKTLFAGTGKTIKIWNLQTGALLSTLNGHTEKVNSVAISPDNKTLVTASNDLSIKLWNIATGKLIKTLNGHSGVILCVTISQNGKNIVSGDVNGDIKIWQLQ